LGSDGPSVPKGTWGQKKGEKGIGGASTNAKGGGRTRITWGSALGKKEENTMGARTGVKSKVGLWEKRKKKKKGKVTKGTEHRSRGPAESLAQGKGKGGAEKDQGEKKYVKE